MGINFFHFMAENQGQIIQNFLCEVGLLRRIEHTEIIFKIQGPEDASELQNKAEELFNTTGIKKKALETKIRELQDKYSRVLKNTPEGNYLDMLTLHYSDAESIDHLNIFDMKISMFFEPPNDKRDRSYRATHNRLMKCLRTTGVEYVGELVTFSEFDLSQIKNIGKGCVEIVKFALAQYNLSLGMDISYRRPSPQEYVQPIE